MNRYVVFTLALATVGHAALVVVRESSNGLSREVITAYNTIRTRGRSKRELWLEPAGADLHGAPFEQHHDVRLLSLQCVIYFAIIVLLPDSRVSCSHRDGPDRPRADFLRAAEDFGPE